MTISIQCSACGKTLRVKDTLRGKRAKCPGCGEVIVIGQRGTPHGQRETEPAVQRLPRRVTARRGRKRKENAKSSSQRPWVIGAGIAGTVAVLAIVIVMSLGPSNEEAPSEEGDAKLDQPSPSSEQSTSADGTEPTPSGTVSSGKTSGRNPVKQAPARSYPSFPDAVTQAPPWLGEDAPFDVVKFLEAPPANENAAPLYLDALFEFSTDLSSCFLPAGEQPQGEVLRRVETARRRIDEYVRFEEAWEKNPESVDEAAVDAWLAQYETGFQKLAEAQERPQCVFETGIGVAALLSHAMAARQVPRVVKWRTRRDVAQGDVERPLQDVAIVLRLSRDIQPRGSMICQLVSVAVDNLCCEEIITQILRADGLRQEHCDRLIGELSRHEAASQRRIAEGMRVEYLLASKYLHDFQYHTGDFSPQAMEDMGMRGRVDSPLACLKLLIDLGVGGGGRLMKEKYGKGAAGLKPDHPLVAFAAGWKHDGKLLSDADYANEVNALNTVYASILGKTDQTTLERWRTARDPAVVEPLRDTQLALLFEPSHWKTWEQAALQAEARLRGTKCLIALRRWQIDHDGPPPDLETMVKAAGLETVPLDPYTDKPLRTTTFMGQPVFYSIGPDGKDDRGREAKWDSKSRTWQGDFPFRLKEPR